MYEFVGIICLFLSRSECQQNTYSFSYCILDFSHFFPRLVTQNVDALHYKAGNRHVIELHGSTHRVMCLSCNHKILRTEMQDYIRHLNPDYYAQSLQMAPDGDVSLTPEQIEGFKVR